MRKVWIEGIIEWYRTRPLSSSVDNLNPDRRQWEIKSKGNGKCTLKSVDKDGFLSTRRSGDRWVPAFSASEKDWHIRCDNNFSYT
jgi:hypothetical protein